MTIEFDFLRRALPTLEGGLHSGSTIRPRIHERTASGTLLWEHLEGHDIGSQVGLHQVLAGLRVNLDRFGA